MLIDPPAAEATPGSPTEGDNITFITDRDGETLELEADQVPGGVCPGPSRSHTDLGAAGNSGVGPEPSRPAVPANGAWLAGSSDGAAMLARWSVLCQRLGWQIAS